MRVRKPFCSPFPYSGCQLDQLLIAIGNLALDASKARRERHCEFVTVEGVFQIGPAKHMVRLSGTSQRENYEVCRISDQQCLARIVGTPP